MYAYNMFYTYSAQMENVIWALQVSKTLPKIKFMQRTLSLFSGDTSLKDNATLGRAGSKTSVTRYSSFFQQGIPHLESS